MNSNANVIESKHEVDVGGGIKFYVNTRLTKGTIDRIYRDYKRLLLDLAHLIDTEEINEDIAFNALDIIYSISVLMNVTSLPFPKDSSFVGAVEYLEFLGTTEWVKQISEDMSKHDFLSDKKNLKLKGYFENLYMNDGVTADAMFKVLSRSEQAFTKTFRDFGVPEETIMLLRNYYHNIKLPKGINDNGSK